MAPRTYLGNPKLKSAGVVHQYTEEQVQEYIKCAKDVEYFARNYIKIVNVDRGLIPFDMWDFQANMLHTFADNRFSICKLCRQSGKSTTSVSYLLWLALFHDQQNIAILANKGALARELLAKVQLAYENLPFWLQQGVVTWNKGNIELENGSKILAAATSSSAIRGGSYNCISGNSEVIIRNTKTKKIEKISIANLYEKNEESEWEVYTPVGFRKFHGISKTYSNSIVTLFFDNGKSICCTEDHKIGTTKGFIEANKLTENDDIITESRITKLVNIEKSESGTEVYDLLNVEETSSFFAEGTLVHNCILLDEFAFIQRNLAEEFFASVYPTISSGKTTKIIIVSTPNGMNHFYKMWVDAIEGRSDYVPIEVHWSDVPGRDEAWKEQTIRNTSEEQFRQEFETEFIGSTSTLINPAKLNAFAWLTPQHDSYGLDYYEEPKFNHSYIIVFDVSEGVGGDYSALSVIDVTSLPYKQVAKYRNKNISPLMFPDIIYRYARWYNDAYVLGETNSIGQQVVNSLFMDLEYENVIATFSKNRNVKVGSGFSARSAFGIRTTKSVKKIGCSNLKTIIESDKLLISDYDTIEEFTTFSAVRDSYQAEAGCHDDLIMTLVLFGWLVTQPYFKDLTNNDIRQALSAENIQNIHDDLLPAGFIDDGENIQSVEHEPNHSGFFNTNFG